MATNREQKARAELLGQLDEALQTVARCKGIGKDMLEASTQKSLSFAESTLLDAVDKVRRELRARTEIELAA